MQILRGRRDPAQRLAISPDSRYVVAVGYQDLHVWDLDDKREEPVRVRAMVYDFQFVNDGLIFRDSRPGWQLLDVTSGQSSIYTPVDGVERVFAVSPSGKVVMAIDEPGGFSCWRRGECGGATPATKVWSDLRRPRNAREVVFTADSGRAFVSTYLSDPSAPGTTQFFWDIFPTTNVGKVVALNCPNSGVTPTLFTPGGGTLLGEYQTRVHAWDAHAGGAGRVLIQYPTRRQFRAIAVHPGGALLAALTTDDAVSFYDAANGHLLRTYIWKIGKLAHLAFTPDGTRCAVTGTRGAVLLFDVD